VVRSNVLIAIFGAFAALLSVAHRAKSMQKQDPRARPGIFFCEHAEGCGTARVSIFALRIAAKNRDIHPIDGHRAVSWQSFSLNQRVASAFGANEL
jgi:hypothetical protein